MQHFSLEVLYRIVGIGSASGLFYRDGTIFIASDNAAYLYEFDTRSQLLDRTKLIASDIPENIPKNQKPDFEAIAEKDGKLYLFGSGSTEKRNTACIVDLKTKRISLQDLSDLYAKMRDASSISPDNFNIEGAIASRDMWLFFQRGNGSGGNNGIFTVSGTLENPQAVQYEYIQLPRIKHVTTSFTDAVLIDDAIWFLATAEDTESTYDDGEVFGSLIGKIDRQTMRVVFSQQVTDTQKFEGLALFSKSDSEITFLLCEDNDTDGMESGIFKLALSPD